MRIRIPTKIDKFYAQLLELFSSFSPIKELRYGDRVVLAEIMYQNYKYKALKPHIRRNTVFSKELKEEMCDNLGISRASFNNSLSALRKAKVLDSNNLLIKALNVFPEGEFEFNVIFEVNEEEASSTGKED